MGEMLGRKEGTELATVRASIGLFQIAPFTPFLSLLKSNSASKNPTRQVLCQRPCHDLVGIGVSAPTHSVLRNMFYTPCSRQNFLQWP